VYFEYICWKFAGRLLDHVNIPLNCWRLLAGFGQNFWNWTSCDCVRKNCRDPVSNSNCSV